MIINTFSWLWHTLVEQPMVIALVFLSAKIGLGWGIVILTSLIKLLTWPFNLASYKHSQQMAALQPEIEKLKDKHKGNPQKLAKAQAQLFKQKGISPAAGCLPGIGQFILIIALYRVLLFQINNFAGMTDWFWLDLTQPDKYFILPILAGVAQFLSSFFMPEIKTASAQINQKQLMMFMSVFIIFIAARFPSGIALYWVISSTWVLIQQVIIRKDLWKKQSKK